MEAPKRIAGLDLTTLRDRAEAVRPQHQAVAEKLKRARPGDLDDTIHDEHRRQFSDIDCLDCANCCRTIPALVRRRDMKRLAGALDISLSDLITRYVTMDEDGDFVLNSVPCPFLAPDNRCTVYAARPDSCRDYPLTLNEGQVELLDVTVENAAVCPAVFRIMERLARHY